MAVSTNREPNFLENLRAERSSIRVWIDRAIVLIWTPALTAAIVWATRRWFSGAAGSGIPQIKAVIDPELSPGQRGLFASLRLTFAKIGLGAAGFLAGLSIGREEPSVQVAAGVMQHARRWLSPQSTLDTRSLLVALASGVAGGLFARLMIASLTGVPQRLSTWRARWPVRFAAVAGLLIAGAEFGPALIAMGMAGFLAAVTQALLTAFIIVMEMVDGHSMVLSLMASAMLASLVSRMISQPLYETLAENMVRGATGKTAAPAEEPTLR